MLDFCLLPEVQVGEAGAWAGHGLPRGVCARTGAGGQVHGTSPAPLRSASG